MAAKRPEGVGPTGLDLLRQMKVGASRARTPSVAFGDLPLKWGDHQRQGSATRGHTGRVSFL